MPDCLIVAAFAEHVRSTYGVYPAFNTMNMPLMVDFLEDCGIKNPIVCSSINKAGYFMSPGIKEYEETLRSKRFPPRKPSSTSAGCRISRESSSGPPRSRTSMKPGNLSSLARFPERWPALRKAAGGRVYDNWGPGTDN
ncbi:MAG: hypothetical protein FJ280_09355 [Planctomycetes bacterium]|nr:hypothetical protein [Planctomycetota bacterium]